MRQDLQNMMATSKTAPVVAESMKLPKPLKGRPNIFAKWKYEKDMKQFAKDVLQLRS